MERLIDNAFAGGQIAAIPSKSDAHRLLVAAALADAPTELVFGDCALSADLQATIACLCALGAKIAERAGGLCVTPIPSLPPTCICDCGESGSTARFLVPVAAALAAANEGGRSEVSFVGHGRLPERPMGALLAALRAHGAAVEADCGDTLPLRVGGGLCGGEFCIAGNVSSQYVTGLLLALPLLGGGRVTLTSPLESRGYVEMTLATLERFGVTVQTDENGFTVLPGRYRSPGRVCVEGDWSNAAVWLCAGALSPAQEGVSVSGLSANSRQGDRAILTLLHDFGAEIEMSGERATVRPARVLRAIDCTVTDIPDLVPVLAVVAAVADGVSIFRDAGRLRLKESDRLESVCALLCALGGDVRIAGDSLVIRGKPSLAGGAADSAGDHRIVMAAALTALRASSRVSLSGAEAVAKSYPGFWKDLKALGGHSAIPV